MLKRLPVPLLIAALGLLVLPPVLLAVIFERYIVSGLTAGAVKG